MSLAEKVIDYQSKPKYDYKRQKFVADESTRFAYYKELEFFQWVKMIMFVMNNLNSFNMSELTYEISSNTFLQTGEDSNSLRVVKIFSEDGNIVDNDGEVALNRGILIKIAKFLCDYVFHIQFIRENIKTISQKHAMRGTGALLVHIVNDYLMKELPAIRDVIYQNSSGKLKFMWEIDDQFNNYGNVRLVEYEDDNEYFNIEPVEDYMFS